MEIKNIEIKKIALYSGLLILFAWSLQNLDTLNNWLKYTFSLFTPFILGLSLAFIINVPMSAIEKRFFSRVKDKNQIGRAHV